MKSRKAYKKKIFAAILSMLGCLIVLAGCGTSEASNVSEPIQWCNGTYAVLTKLNNGNISIFGGMAHNIVNKQVMLKTLDEAWGVTTKEELDEMIGSLTAGHHNPVFLEEAEEYGITDMTPNEFEAALEGVKSSEAANYFKNMFDAYQQFEGNAIMGWDLSRAVQLCAYGYIADFYSYEDSTNAAIEICKQIQNTFDSWDDFFASYLYGYVYWSEDDVDDPKSDYAERVKLLQDLKFDKTSPLNLDWNLDLGVS